MHAVNVCIKSYIKYYVQNDEIRDKNIIEVKKNEHYYYNYYD